MQISKPQRVWTVAEAKARLSEILRLSETEGPQRIGARKPFIVVPAHIWAEKEHRQPMGRWLVENMPRGTNLEVPADRHSQRDIPFIDGTDE